MLPVKGGTGHDIHTKGEVGIHSATALNSAPVLAYLKQSPVVRSVERDKLGAQAGLGDGESAQVPPWIEAKG